jgi:hypothetical protein
MTSKILAFLNDGTIGQMSCMHQKQNMTKIKEYFKKHDWYHHKSLSMKILLA